MFSACRNNREKSNNKQNSKKEQKRSALRNSTGCNVCRCYFLDEWLCVRFTLDTLDKVK